MKYGYEYRPCMRGLIINEYMDKLNVQELLFTRIGTHISIPHYFSNDTSQPIHMTEAQSSWFSEYQQIFIADILSLIYLELRQIITFFFEYTSNLIF